MVLTFALIFVGAYNLWRGREWVYWLMLAALGTGTAAFLLDVDFSSPLGLQF